MCDSFTSHHSHAGLLIPARLRYFFNQLLAVRPSRVYNEACLNNTSPAIRLALCLPAGICYPKSISDRAPQHPKGLRLRLRSFGSSWGSLLVAGACRRRRFLRGASCSAHPASNPHPGQGTVKRSSPEKPPMLRTTGAQATTDYAPPATHPRTRLPLSGLTQCPGSPSQVLLNDEC